MTLPFLVASIAPALVVTNFLIYLMPPARRAMNNEDRDFPGTGYASSQKALTKVGMIVFAIAAVLSLIGAAM